MKDLDFKEWLSGFWGKLKKLPWKRIGLITLCVVLSLILISLIFVTVYVEHLLGKINYVNPAESQPSEGYTDPTFSSDATLPSIDVTIPTAPDTVIAHKDIVNIMLVGQDRRSGNYRTNSDVMILCTFNTKDKTITLTSFMRDLYVSIPGHGMNKMNAAYPKGGMSLLGNTMLENFGVQVDNFIEVDFNGFKQIVNTLGGIDMYLTAAEAEYMNTTPWDGLNSDGWALTEGVNHLNGDQALAYSRIRAIGWDYERTERQRKVLTAIISKCKTMNLSTAMNLLNEFLPLVGTDMDKQEIVDYAMDLFPLLTSGQIVTQRIPAQGTYEDVKVNGQDVIIADFELNHQFLVDTLIPD